MPLSALRQSMRQSLLCCSVPQLHCPLMSVELSDVFTGAFLVHFEESVSPHSVCFLGNHCSADPFFAVVRLMCARGERSPRARKADVCTYAWCGALFRALPRGMGPGTRRAGTPPRAHTHTSQAGRKPGTHLGCL